MSIDDHMGVEIRAKVKNGLVFGVIVFVLQIATKVSLFPDLTSCYLHKIVLLHLNCLIQKRAYNIIK